MQMGMFMKEIEKMIWEKEFKNMQVGIFKRVSGKTIF